MAEVLTSEERANELIMTGLRITEGFNLEDIGEMNLIFDQQQHKTIEENIQKGYLLLNDGRLQITKDGMLFADHIASELFFL
jgi:oxygen-independent coproporphyrinogen-3 oxidase